MQKGLIYYTKFFFSVIFIVFFTSLDLSGQVSLMNIKNINVNELTSNDILKLKSEMQKKNMTIESLETLVISNGMSSSDFLLLKNKLESSTPMPVTAPSNVTAIEKSNDSSDSLNTKTKLKPGNLGVYGSEIFSSTSLSFEPNSNMATPSSYVLGPGDELQIVIYGMQEYAGPSTVSKEGKISIPVVGQVFVNGLTFDAAQVQIKKACSKIYSSLNSGQSGISVSLSKIRTIRVTIIGAQRSGNYSVSSLSTVFNALHIAGGPNSYGSYRKIELIRNNQVIKIIDIYRFLAKGDQSDNINLQENDVIRIPTYDSRVTIEGNVKRPGIFELLPSENFNDLLEYCGGFDELAYRKNVKLIQNSNHGIKVIDLSEDKFTDYKSHLGDVIKVSGLTNKFENKVTIKGAVFRPDVYEFSEGMTVKSLIDKSDGLTQDAYVVRALLIREKSDLTKEIQNVNLSAILNGSEDITLRKNDELVISSSFEFKNKHTVKISGEVNEVGEYPYIENMTLYDLILLSGGLTDRASKKVDLNSIIIKDEKSGGNTKVSDVLLLEIDTLLLDETKNVKLKPYDFIQVRKKPIFETQRDIVIKGQVEYPGVYVITDKKERILDVINRSGGFKYNADQNSIRVVRKIEQFDELGVVTTKEVTIPVDYKNIVKSPSSDKNFILQMGDVIVVGEMRETVAVIGNVQINTEIPFMKRKVKFFISAAGGFLDNADKRRIYVVHPNGMAESTRLILGIRKYPKVLPGSNIIVPAKIKDSKEKISAVESIGIAGMVVSFFGTILGIIRLTK